MKSFKLILISGIILFCVVLLVIFRADVTGFLVRARFLPQSLLDPSFNYAEFQRLKLENQSLTQELGALAEKNAVPPDRYHYLAAEIYSHYPLNDRGLLVINAGSAEGLREGLPVLAEKGIVLGKITGVKRTQSEVQTVFDSEWRSSVAVGSKRAEALLKGGNSPHLELIAKDAAVGDGDTVVNISPEIPLNYSLGKISDLVKDNTDTWLNATLILPYRIETLTQVLIITDYP